MSEDVSITWRGWSTFSLTLQDGSHILIDPWLEGNPHCPAECQAVEGLDLMLLTHGHPDHIGDAVRLAKQFKPTVMANFEICHWLMSKGVENCVAMNFGGTVGHQGINISMVQAVHSSDIVDDGVLVPGGHPGGFVLTLPTGLSLYHAGDTALFSDLKLIGDLHQPDVALLPIGDTYVMPPTHAAMAVDMIEPKLVIPMHYDRAGEQAKEFCHLIESKPETRCAVLQPGKPLVFEAGKL